MPLQAKTRRVTPRRRTPIVAPRRSHSSPLRVGAKSRHTKKSHVVAEVKVHNPATGSGFKSALRFLETLTDYERLRIVRYNTQNFDLDRMRHLLKKLGNPNEQYKSVHIAGTKGKGSTCAMVANMLQANGYKVGLYTSPHLVDIRERIQVNGVMIPHADFSRLMRLVEPIVMRAKPMPTFFDVMTAVAFKYFAEQKIDVAIVETGLGGRLDSTNVLKPEVTAITSISKDHMAQLGHTLPKIAEEKAGIFKPGVPALSVTQTPEVEAVLKRISEKVGAPFDITGKTIEFSYRFEATRMLGTHNRICLPRKRHPRHVSQNHRRREKTHIPQGSPHPHRHPRQTSRPVRKARRKNAPGPQLVRRTPGNRHPSRNQRRPDLHHRQLLPGRR